MIKGIPFIAILAVLSGCQSVATKPQLAVEFSGYLEQPKAPLLIELKPTKQYSFKTEATTGSDTVTSYVEESITQMPHSLLKRSRMELGELLGLKEGLRMDLILSLLPNGIVTNVNLDELSVEGRLNGKVFTAETDSDREKIKELKALMLKYFEKKGMFNFAKRYPDYAWGKSINTGFKSTCWREEKTIEVLFVAGANESRKEKIPRSDISADTDSECSFLGVTYIEARKAAVFREQVYSTFRVKGNPSVFNISYSGWKALDIDRGVILESEHTMAIYVNGQKMDNSTVSTKISVVSIK